MNYNLYIWRLRNDDNEAPQMLTSEDVVVITSLADVIASMQPCYATRMELWHGRHLVTAWGIP